MDTGRALTFSLNKREIGPVNTNFQKTSGVYKQEGELGQGTILYNIQMGTKLKQSNEFLIYDTPDVNMSFEGNMSIHVPTTYGGVNNRLTTGNYYADPNDSDVENRMEIFVYDIYYLTEDKGTLAPRQAEYEENTVMLQRKDTMTGADTLESMDTVTKPKNILVEKMSGEALTEGEQKIIDDNGGLYQTVGKGFKVRIKNFKGKGQSQGGYLTLVYRMKIQNNSPIVDSQGFPSYLNRASYYGQEIPSCTPDDDSCTPIAKEKTSVNQIPQTSATVTPGSISGEVDAYSKVNFIKVAADAEGQPDMNQPLGGAVFNIHKILEDGSREIAVNKDGLNMENLITNEDGQLCTNNQEKTLINLRLERGNYIFEEVSAPENHEIIQQETPVVVGLLANNVVIANAPKEELKYEVVYRFEGADKGKELPQAVLDLLPGKKGNIKDNTEVTAATLSKTEVKTGNGIWIFQGWDKDSVVINGANEEFVGLWNYEENGKDPEYEVVYRFESADKEKELPQAVLDLLPEKQGNLKDNTEVTAVTISETEAKSGNGIWNFQGWDKDSAVINGANVEFIGLWAYEESGKEPEKPVDENNTPGTDVPKNKKADSTDGETNNVPQTGDLASIVWPLVLLSLSGLASGTVLIYRKKTKRDRT